MDEAAACGTEEAGDMDVGAAWMRGTTESGSTDEAVARTRRQHGQGGGTDKAAAWTRRATQMWEWHG